MNFSYIDEEDPLYIPEPIPVPDVELDERWNNLKIDLDDFNQEFKETSILAISLEGEIKTQIPKITKLRNMLTQFDDDDDLIDLVGKVELKFNLSSKQTELNLLRGKIQAMRKIIDKPNLPNRFQCFVCLENDVDTMIDPCGHTMCSICIIKSQSTGRTFVCPACRSNVDSTRNLFFIA
jgi:hypothetical protein